MYVCMYIAKRLSARHLIAEYWLSLGCMTLYICLSRFGMQTLNETSRHLGMQSFLSVLIPITISTTWLSANARACDSSVSRLGAALVQHYCYSLKLTLLRQELNKPTCKGLFIASLVCHCLLHQPKFLIME